jgi:ppGpp synthetase/RelA/SpoT-type nucleotidyltranferase
MNYQSVIDQVEPLLSICVKMADRQDLSEIKISKARAKEILSLISSLKKERVTIPKIRKGVPAWLINP